MAEVSNWGVEFGLRYVHTGVRLRAFSKETVSDEDGLGRSASAVIKSKASRYDGAMAGPIEENWLQSTFSRYVTRISPHG